MHNITEKSVFIAADHAGVDLKAQLQRVLVSWQWVDLGPSRAETVDYPDYAELLARNVAQDPGRLRGVLICGSGIGMCIAANKIPGIRAAMVESLDAARLSREHNNANVLCLGARLLKLEMAVKIVKIWLETPFTKDSRHQVRIDKIAILDNKKV